MTLDTHANSPPDLTRLAEHLRALAAQTLRLERFEPRTEIEYLLAEHVSSHDSTLPPPDGEGSDSPLPTGEGLGVRANAPSTDESQASNDRKPRSDRLFPSASPYKNHPHPNPLPEGEGFQSNDGDTALWRIATDVASTNKLNAIPVSAIIDINATGPLFEQGLYRAIEVWTEAELCGLHALSLIATQLADTSLRERCARACRWHIEHTQPDNATNRPWALDVFLTAGSAEGRHYAETLLHNAIAVEGRPTPLCAMILLDAADALFANRPA